MEGQAILERLKALRKHLGLNQREFAGRLCLSQTALSMIETGKTALTGKNIKLLCTAFNVNERWLRTGEGAMFASSSPYLGELLNIFDRLTPDTQEFLVEMARGLLKRQDDPGKK